MPPLLNDFIALMKDTSLVSVIGLLEVVQVGRDVQQTDLNSSALMLGAIMFLGRHDPARKASRLPDRPPAAQRAARRGQR